MVARAAWPLFIGSSFEIQWGFDSNNVVPYATTESDVDI